MRSSHSHETVMILEKFTKPNGEVETRKYTIGNLLGSGGFAKVYEVTDIATNRKMAGKVISKASIQSAEQKQKLMAEINSHRILKHQNVVRLETFFEDKDNIYILLELCSPQTLNDYLQKKQRLTEIEVQKFLSQLIDALKYIHNQRIVHRDIKLKNLFMTEDMNVKLGDFGLSCKLSSYGERRYTVCGTPNYIAPEILTKAGHSYQVDIWALGVVFYYLLFGAAPFENPDNKIIYKKIKENNYSFPPDIPVSADAKNLISRILVLNPEKRPSLDEILQHPFFAYPRQIPRDLKKPLLDVSSNRTSLKPILKREPSPGRRMYVDTKPVLLAIEDHKDTAIKLTSPVKAASMPMSSSSKKAQEIANKLTAAGSAEDLIKLNEVKTNRHSAPGPGARQKPAEQEKMYVDFPVQSRRSSVGAGKEESDIYVVKWLDYASKYGMGYTLSDESIGVVFNDQSKITCQNLHNKEFMYIEDSGFDGTEKVFTYRFDRYPDALEKKVALYNYFKEYLDHNKTGVSIVTTVESHQRKRTQATPGQCMYVSKWIKTKQAIFFKLSTKMMEIVFKDGVVITLKPTSGNVEYIARDGDRSYYGLNEALEVEDKEIAKRMAYVQDTLKEMWRHRNLEDRLEK